MTTKRIYTNLSSNPELNARIRKAIEEFDKLSDEEKAAHRREQAIDWVYGETLLARLERGEPELSDTEKEELRNRIARQYDRR